MALSVIYNDDNTTKVTLIYKCPYQNCTAEIDCSNCPLRHLCNGWRQK
jgi:hypothetical protein